MSVEEHCAVQFDSAQNLRESVHRNSFWDYQQSFPDAMQSNLLALDAGARTGDAKAWFALLWSSTILAWASNPRNDVSMKKRQHHDKSDGHLQLRNVCLGHHRGKSALAVKVATDSGGLIKP
jgi:hypothetical protein